MDELFVLCIMIGFRYYDGKYIAKITFVTLFG